MQNSISVSHAISILKDLDCTVEVVRTGHESYKRGFIKYSKTGCQIGRMVIFNEEFQHIKWYSYGHQADGISTRFDFAYSRDLPIIPLDIWRIVIERAEAAQVKNYEEKLAKRSKLNAIYPKKRRAIQKGNLGSFIEYPYDLMNNLGIQHDI